MTWYNSGTVTVTNGQQLVTGAGTDFVSNVLAGQAFVGPDNRAYEIQQVVSATQIMLRRPYLGGTGAGQGYDILPTQSLMKDLADQAAALIASFGDVRDGIGQGLMPDGTNALPGLRFAADQDTGIRRVGVNAFALATGGIDRFSVNTDGAAIGTTANDGKGALLIEGSDQNVPALIDAGSHGASIYLRALATGAGAGGAVLFGTTFGAKTPFAAIKGSVTEGASATIGDLHVALRNAVGDGSLTNRFTFTRAGFLGIGSATPYSQAHVRGAGASSLDIADSAARGATLYLQDTNGFPGAGGAIVLGTSNGNGTPFAGIRGYLTDGADNTVGDLVLCTRGSTSDTQLSARWRIGADGLLKPALDNTFDLGTASLRVRTVYAASGTINTSDARTKQQISDVPDEWLDAWGEVRHVRFKFNDAVEAKGESARWHVGYIAQDIRDAFASHDLDATEIGLLCHDEWGEETAPEIRTETKIKRTPRAIASAGLVDAQGNPMVTWTYDEEEIEEQVPTGGTVVVRETGDLWSIRPDECSAMEAAWQRREIARQAARIAALEAAA
jgi:hypothetical protein